ncbi:hypothetical protein X989_4081 [Burkholderia pseudomallei MSHR4378]|nr:hypothetical protein X989_4081 [Burkholderia pseudomallei MSHR4378]
MRPTTARDDVGVARLPVRPSRGCRALAPGAQVGREGDGTAAGRASYASHAMAPRVLGGSHGFAARPTAPAATAVERLRIDVHRRH